MLHVTKVQREFWPRSKPHQTLNHVSRVFCIGRLISQVTRHLIMEHKANYRLPTVQFWWSSHSSLLLLFYVLSLLLSFLSFLPSSFSINYPSSFPVLGLNHMFQREWCIGTVQLDLIIVKLKKMSELLKTCHQI